MRKKLLVSGHVYHIFTRSIAGFKIFNNEIEFLRMVGAIQYYQRENPEIRFAKFIQLDETTQYHRKNSFLEKEKLVEIIAYCLMPTHIHLILKQLKQNGISIFMSNLLNSYSRYFNVKHKRKGPLWEARFKSALVETDEYLLHLTRYIHLNPVTASLVSRAEDWEASSYQEYLLERIDRNIICKYADILDIKVVSYRQFVEDGIAYQKDLAKIKKVLLE